MVNPDDLPPEVREGIERQHDLHHMSHTQGVHEVRDFLHDLTKDQLVTLQNMMSAVINGTAEDNERGAYHIGRITEILSLKFGVCPCGQDHDKEAADFMAPPQPHLTEDQVKEVVGEMEQNQGVGVSRGDARTILRMRVHDIGKKEGWSDNEVAAATADGLRMLDEVLYSKDQPTEAESTATNRDDLLKQYNVLDIPAQFPKVTCAKGCGYTWISLEDRMLRPADKCEGCQNKEAWG